MGFSNIEFRNFDKKKDNSKTKKKFNKLLESYSKGNNSSCNSNEGNSNDSNKYIENFESRTLESENFDQKFSENYNKFKENYNQFSSNYNNYWSDKKWGACLWESIHAIAFSYPENPTEEDKMHAKNFILSLQYLIPCQKCCKNYTKNLDELSMSVDMAVESKLNFSYWSWLLHNMVNEETGKEMITFEKCCQMYNLDADNIIHSKTSENSDSNSCDQCKMR